MYKECIHVISAPKENFQFQYEPNDGIYSLDNPFPNIHTFSYTCASVFLMW